jgi:DNA repair protein RecO (recombination protein O)
MRNYSSLGIVLSRKNYGEADRILTVITKHYGKKSLIAKGVRKTGSRKRGHLEIFSLISFSASAGRGMDILTEVETVDSYKNIRRNLRKVALMYYFVEVAVRLLNEDEKNEKYFETLRHFFNRVKDEKKLKSLRKEFIFNTLTQFGFWPIGKKMEKHDFVMQNILEKDISTIRVGKKLLNIN